MNAALEALHEAGPLLLLAIVLLAGSLFGALARRLHLPGITGQIVGVMALSRQGLAFETPDQRPVHCMVLLGTAPEERDRHLQVLASLARTVDTDRVFQDQLFDAKSAAHAYELLHGEESEDFNYFMEDALES